MSWRLSVRARAIRKLGRAVAPTAARSARHWPARPTDSSRTDGPTERPDPLSAAARRAPALLSPRRLMAQLNFRIVRPRPFYFNPIWRPTSWTRACDSASSASRCFLPRQVHPLTNGRTGRREALFPTRSSTVGGPAQSAARTSLALASNSSTTGPRSPLRYSSLALQTPLCEKMPPGIFPAA